MYNFDNGIAPYFSYSESFLPVLNVEATGNLLKPETGLHMKSVSNISRSASTR